jgi:hypothetical protein
MKYVPKDSKSGITYSVHATPGGGGIPKLFPPHMWLFLVNVFLMMIGHGLSAFVFGFYYLRLGADALVMLTMTSVIVMVIPNILITRGYSVARHGLLGLLGIYFLTGISTFLPSIGENASPVLGLIITTISALGIFILSTKQYKEITYFYKNRWHEFRLSGKPYIRRKSES